MISKTSLLFACLGTLFLSTHSFATRIYKSVDANGNVTYSSTPPANAVSIEKISVPTNYDINQNADALANFQAIKQTADQFEEERKQREQEREAARKQREKEEEEAKKQAEKPVEKEIRYVPVYPPYYYPGQPRHPHPHPHPPKPKPKPRHPQPEPTPSPTPPGIPAQ